MNYFLIFLILIISHAVSFAAMTKPNGEKGPSTNGVVDKFYVGADPACDYSTIQAAINAAGSSVNAPEVLVADNKVYDENLFISTSNILIDGSYANCANARIGVHGGNSAKVRGFPASAIATMQITGLFVSIKNLQLDTNNGGGIKAHGTSIITLENMLFFQLGDSAIDVGGSGQVVLNVTKSIFLLNQSPQGGAIRCSGPNHSIQVSEGSGFGNNTATSWGGAVFLQSSCEFSMTDGTFTNNSSGSVGGGIFALSGAKVDLNRVTFSGNKTGSEGGALLAHGNSTVINAEATHFLRNQSEGIGGAIAVDGGASFTLRRTNKGCFNYDKCNFFDGNTASEEGGAIHNSESHVDISSTHFSSNRANIGSAYYTEGTVNSNKIEGSIFSQNGNHAAGGFNDRNVIRATNGSDITVTYSTFADNNVLFATFGLENASTMYLYSSIVYDSSSGDVFDINGGSTHDVDCLLVHESGSFNTTNAKVTVANPEFIDAANQNFHIKTAISPAVDYCSDSEAMAVHKDIDFQTRGFNNELITDLFGPYDIGADESFGNRIFMDGFE